ncbi:hypothetical protein TpMuguga_02g00782 [Theileria parva strain Muguga]|uniref:Uncharacterized protein n=1 Tax=Theileria parva TaxID=5875 RepID=Q4N457_THEPA|nr:uncharacterized protein TpMuguga_02g00782 [Theileria parva strain Muguga]EAN33066.1 hypothetical protein TpMuguga_02g00782 [Theileria parva strain Muguga]|eukprot:XP_765349.1 hypothetical protein [Theileria parva strain Muguga]
MAQTTIPVTTGPQVSGPAVTPSATTPVSAATAVATPKVAPSGRPVTLNISGKVSTDDYDYTVDHNRNVKIFTAKGSSMFNKVFKDETPIWTTNDSTNYVTKVFTDGIGTCSSTKNVTIYLFNGQIEHYCKSEGGWQKASNKISLDLGKTSSTIGFDFHHDGERRTFTAKPGYLFKNVFLSGCIAGNTFWDAKTDSECSSKVVVYGVESSIRNVNVFLENDKVIHAHRVGSDWISKTGFVLDINTNKNNDLFDYRSTRGFGHFNPKANLSITRIVKKELRIWSAKDNDYGLKVVLMGSGKDVKHLSILLQSGKFVLLSKSGQNKPWQDVTQNKHNFSGVRLFSLEEGTSKYHQLTKEDYEPIVFECRYGYEFKNDVRCVMITNMDMVLWSHTEDTEFGYPKGFYLDLRQNKFSVTSLKDQTKEVTPTKISAAISVATPVVKVPVAEPVKAPVAKEAIVTPKATLVAGPPIVKLYSSKPGELTCKVEKEFDDFDYFLEDLKCEVITHDGNCVWKHETGKPYPRYMSYNEEDCKIVVSFEKEYYTCTIQDSKWKSVIRSYDAFGTGGIGPSYAFGDTSALTKSYSIIATGDTIKPTEAKTVAAPAVTAPAKPSEATSVALDIEKKQTTTEYDYKDDNGVVTYTPKAGHLFNKVSEGQHEIWKSVANVFGTLVRTKESKGINYLVVLLTNRTFTLFQEADEDWTDITSKRHDVAKLKFLGEGDAVLKETDYDVTIVDMSFSHTFKSGVNCKKVKLGQEVVWKSGDDPKFQQITVFSLGLASNCFFIKNPSGEVKKIEYEAKTKEEVKETVKVGEPTKPTEAKPVAEPAKPVAEPTKEVTETIKPATAQVTTAVTTQPTTTPVVKETPKPAGPPKPAAPAAPEEPLSARTDKSIDLDIDKTEGTDKIEYSKSQSGNIHNFTPKGDHLFIKITEKNDVVWESRSNLFGTKVIFISEGNKNYVGIILDNGGFVLLNKFAGKWDDITNTKYDVMKLKFYDDKNKELTSSSYTVALVDYSYRFTFNDEKTCKKVKYGEDDVWKSTDPNTYKEIKMFDLAFVSNSFFIGEDKNKFKKLDFKPTTTSVTQPKVTPVTTAAVTTPATTTPSAQPKTTPATTTTTATPGTPATTTGTTAATPTTPVTSTTPAAQPKATPTTTTTPATQTPVTAVTPAETTTTPTTPAAKTATPTTPVTTATTNQLTLDIAKNQSTNEIDYSKSDDNKYHKYAPKSGKVFSKVTQGTVQIWSSTGNVNGTLVRVRTENNEKHVAIMLSNNGFKLFHSSDKGNKWEDITSKRHDITKVKFYDDKNKELKTPDYTVSLVDFAYRFTLKSGVKCKNIKHNNKDVWKSSDDNNFKNITLIELGLVSNDFFVHKDENTKKKLNFK